VWVGDLFISTCEMQFRMPGRVNMRREKYREISKPRRNLKKQKYEFFLPQYICIDFLITWFSGANAAIKGAPLHGVRTLKKSFYLLI